MSAPDYRQAAARQFTAEDYAAHVRDGDLAEPYLSMLRQAAADRERLEQIREWTNISSDDWPQTLHAKWQVRAILGDPHE
jgi:hypothetical protein